MTVGMEPLATEDQHVSFWRAHVRSSVLVAVGGGVIVTLYALLTWSAPARPTMLGVGLAAAVLAPPILLAVEVERLVRSRWGAPYFYLRESIAIALVTLLVWLDGGVTSPLALLYVLVLVHGVVAYPVTGALFVTAAAVAAYITVATFNGATTAATKAGWLVIAATAGVAGIGARGHLGVRQQQRAIQQALEEQVHTDGLTGALNHQGLHERARARMAAANPGRPMAALAVDIDGFKQLNDTRGHLVGDDVLRCLTETLRAVCRADDLIGRPGGDEAIVVMPGAPIAVAHGAAERIHARLAIEGAPVTVSIGVGWTPGPVPVEELLQRADEALYAAKAAGRACTRSSEPGVAPLV